MPSRTPWPLAARPPIPAFPISYRRRGAWALAALLCAALAGCGGGEGSSGTDATTTTSGSPQGQGDGASAADDRKQALAGGTGAPAGTPIFFDRLNKGDRLKAIRVCSGGYVDSIQLTVERPKAAPATGFDLVKFPVRGGPGGSSCPEFELAADEAVVRVFGSGNGIIDSIGFETNKRTLGPFGPPGGFPFSMSPAGAFRGFSGAVGTYAGQAPALRVTPQKPALRVANARCGKCHSCALRLDGGLLRSHAGFLLG